MSGLRIAQIGGAFMTEYIRNKANVYLVFKKLVRK